jgi:hypothetical protein
MTPKSQKCRHRREYRQPRAPSVNTLLAEWGERRSELSRKVANSNSKAQIANRLSK